MIEVSRESFLSAAERCARVADPKSTIPVVANTLLVAKGSQLSFRATNLRHEVTGTIEATGSGTLAVNARDLLAAVSSLEGAKLTLTETKTMLVVKGEGRRSFKLQLAEPEEFPAAMKVTGSPVEFAAGDLQRLIAGTLFAVSTDTTTRSNLCCVRLEGRGGKSTATATNGVCLATDWIESSAEFAVSIPTETAKLILSAEGGATLEHDQATFAVTVGGVRIAATQPSGEFPNVSFYIEALPKALGAVTIPAERLRETLVALRKQTDDMRLRFTPDSLDIYSFDQDSESDDAFEVACSGEGELWLPGSVVASALSGIAGDVELSFADALAPLWLRSGNWASLVMPRNPDVVKSKVAA